MRVLGVVVTVAVFMVFGSSSSESRAATNTSKFLNKTGAPANKMHVWVAKRHRNDGNNAGDIAVAFQILDDNLQNGSELEGRAFLFDKVATDGKYVLRTTFIVKSKAGHPQGGHGGGVGENSRRREICTFVDSPTDPRIRLHATIFKGKDHGTAAHRRIVLRYKEYPAVVPAPVPAKANGCDQVDPGAAGPAPAPGDCCDEVPNDDVLEEETVDVDAAGNPILPP